MGVKRGCVTYAVGSRGILSLSFVTTYPIWNHTKIFWISPPFVYRIRYNSVRRKTKMK